MFTAEVASTVGTFEREKHFFVTFLAFNHFVARSLIFEVLNLNIYGETFKRVRNIVRFSVKTHAYTRFAGKSRESEVPNA